MKVIISVNYIMTVNQFPSIPMYWDWDHFVGNVGDSEYLCENKISRSLTK